MHRPESDNLSDEDRRRLVEAGRRWGSDIQGHRDLVLSIYTPLAAKAAKDGVKVVRDVRYGRHERHVLDLFVPEGREGCDVAVFVHGGAFVRGSKRVNDEIYDNFCYWFARQGVLVVNVEYRLAQDAPYPGGAQDVSAAVDWCVGHVREFGGNPDRLFLVGHSAGATHVGTYLGDPVMASGPAAGIAGAVLISGRLRADVRPGNPNAKGVRAYFGDDETLLDERSPVTHAHRVEVPVMVAIAEYENPYLDNYGLEYAHRLAAARDRAPDVIRMLGHNHTSMLAHFNTGEDLLGRRILRFMQGVE